MRWLEALQEYRIQIAHISGIQNTAALDSCNPHLIKSYRGVPTTEVASEDPEEKNATLVNLLYLTTFPCFPMLPEDTWWSDYLADSDIRAGYFRP